MPIFRFVRYTVTELFRRPNNWRQIYRQTSLISYISKDLSQKRVDKKTLLGRYKQGIPLKICWGLHLCEMTVELLLKNALISKTSENIYLFVFISRLVSVGVWIHIKYLQTPNNKCLQELIKRSSKVQEKIMSYEHALSFDQWKTLKN